MSTSEERRKARISDQKRRQNEADESKIDMTKQSAGMDSIVRKAIAESGMSPNTLGERSGISRQQLYRYVKGERGLTLDSLDRLCFVLGLTLTPIEKKTGTNDS